MLKGNIDSHAVKQGNFTVLIVDDTPTNVLILKKTLNNSGYRVITAESGVAGRQLADEFKPDLILLDIMMPDEDGFETISKLKASPATASIPVIFLTALSDVASKIKGFDLGAVDYITKPFHPQEIRARTGLHIKLSIATNALIESQKDKLKQIKTAQRAMLIQPEELPEAKFAAYYSSLHEAGGDFYEVIKINDYSCCYFVADVSGHDIASGFITASMKALLQQNCSHIYSPAETMKIINEVLMGVLPEDKYLTACYLVINRKTNRVSMVNMGHPPIIYQPFGKKPKLLEKESDVLGAFHDVVLSEYSFKVNAGDRLFIYSDGLIESQKDRTVWSSNLEALTDCANDIKDADLSESVKSIYDYFFPNDKPPEDDIVILGIEV